MLENLRRLVAHVPKLGQAHAQMDRFAQVRKKIK
jgi:hypothetical protein